MNTATRAVPALVPLANGLGVTRLFAAGFPQGQGKERKGKERREGIKRAEGSEAKRVDRMVVETHSRERTTGSASGRTAL